MSPVNQHSKKISDYFSKSCDHTILTRTFVQELATKYNASHVNGIYQSHQLF
ncbi:hypothetical protein DSUL_100041 [Desulfovibrionales bacterium]